MRFKMGKSARPFFFYCFVSCGSFRVFYSVKNSCRYVPNATAVSFITSFPLYFITSDLCRIPSKLG
jgi:hypothetical protein